MAGSAGRRCCCLVQKYIDLTGFLLKCVVYVIFFTDVFQTTPKQLQRGNDGSVIAFRGRQVAPIRFYVFLCTTLIKSSFSNLPPWKIALAHKNRQSVNQSTTLFQLTAKIEICCTCLFAHQNARKILFLHSMSGKVFRIGPIYLKFIFGYIMSNTRETY